MTVRVASFATIGEAEMARSALRAAGIDAEVRDEQTIAVDWLYSNAIGGVKLVVPEEDLEAAAELLTNGAATDVPDDVMPTIARPRNDNPPHVAAPAQCPECGSTESTRLPRLAIFALLSLLMYGIGLVADQRDLALAGIAAAALITIVLPSRRCSSCGTRWPDEPPAEDDDDLHAPPPDGHDLVEELCPRCGAAEFHTIDHRRLKAWPFLFSPSIVAVTLMWPFVPKKECDACGFRR